MLADWNADGRLDMGAPVRNLGETPYFIAYANTAPRQPYRFLGLGTWGGQLPLLVGTGTLAPGTPYSFAVAHAHPSSIAVAIAGSVRIDLPTPLGILVPNPDVVLQPLYTTAAGTLSLAGTWSAAVPAGTTVFLQFFVYDPVAVLGWSATDGLRLIAP